MQTMKNVEKIEVLKPTPIMVGKKGNAPVVFTILGVACTLGGIWAYNTFVADDSESQELAMVKTQVTMPDGTVVEHERDTMSQALCGDAKTTAMDFVTVNPLDQDGKPTYPAVTLKIQDADGSGALRSYTTDTDGTFAASSLTVNCGDGYMGYAPASKNTSASAKFPFTAMKPTDNIQLDIEQIDHISVKAYDNLNHGDVYDTQDGTAGDYEDIAAGAVTFKSVTGNTTAYAMSTDGELDMTFTMKVATQKTWGDLKNYIALDADASDYAKTPVLMFEGKALTEVGKGALDADDQGYLSGYEYIYELPYDISATSSELRLKATAKASQDPDVDIVIKPVAESYWVDGTKVVKSIFKSDGSEVLISPQTITIDVS